MASNAKLLQSVFAKLPFAAWCYFALSFALHPQSRIRNFELIDADDYLYLAQAIDAIKGQGWFDLVQHRMNPPEGTWIHFSHLLSGLYALGMKGLMPWMDIQTAAFVVAVAFPLIFFALLLVTARWVAQPFVGKNWANLTSPIIPFLFALTLQFAPGHVDHHGLEAVLALAAFGCVMRVMALPSATMPPIFSGFLLALALVLGLESLPVQLIISGWIGLWVTIEGRAAVRSGMLFSVTLFISGLFFFLVTIPFNHIFAFNLDSFSLAYVILSGGIAACVCVACKTSHKLTNLNHRLIITSLFFAIVLGTFLAAFPDLKNGPYGGADSNVVRLILHHALEARPALDGGLYPRSIFLPLFALIISVDLFRQKQSMRWQVGLLSVVLLASYVLALFYQQRFMVYAEAFSIIPLTYGLKRVWSVTQNWEDKTNKIAARTFIIVAVGPLTTLLMPLMGHHLTNNKNPLLFPVPVFQTPCDEGELAPVLNGRFGDHPRLIMNTMAPSAEILLRTQHSILAAPFHMNTSGNLDSFAFFTATDIPAAQSLLKRRNVDLILLCKNLDSIYTNSEENYVPQARANERFMIQHLIDGNIPEWLEPITDPSLKTYMLFEVKKDLL